MTTGSTVETLSPRLREVMERAKDPEYTFLSLAHLIDDEALLRAYRRLRTGAAVGIDGKTKETYGQELEHNIRDLHERLRTKRWRHQPIRRVHIPKERGKTRPIGISSIEDKIVQESLREILAAVYEPIFCNASYGFRPGRGAHDALRALNQALFSENVSHVLEIDIESFFCSIDRKLLQEMLRSRVADKSLRRLVGKCLHVGILDDSVYSEPSEGTVQGSVLSPLLGNVYLHHVLDLWVERDVLPRMKGRVHLVRYADDAVMTFELEEDAHRVMMVLGKRFERYKLRLHPEKTRLTPFQRPSRTQRKGKGPGTFDFLGMTHFWYRARSGHWVPRVKTRKASLRRFMKTVADVCRRQRHAPVKDQHAALKRRIVGHFNYFGVNGNATSLRRVRRACEAIWHKWLNRRSQRARKSWTQYQGLLRTYPMPPARIRVQLWQTPP